MQYFYYNCLKQLSNLSVTLKQTKTAAVPERSSKAKSAMLIFLNALLLSPLTIAHNEMGEKVVLLHVVQPLLNWTCILRSAGGVVDAEEAY